MGGYLTYAGQLDRGRFEAVLRQLALLEQETLEQRAAVRTARQSLTFCSCSQSFHSSGAPAKLWPLLMMARALW